MNRFFDTLGLREQADETIQLHEDSYPSGHECPAEVFGICLAFRHATQLRDACIHIEWMNGDLAMAQDPEVAMGTFIFDQMENDHD